MRDSSWSNRTISARLLTAGFAVLLSVGLSVAADAPTAPGGVTALQCGHLIDTVAGKVLGETTIVIEAGHVREVLNGLQAPAGAKAIDLKSQTCMPGLIDSHVHLTGETSRTEYVDRYHWNVADYAIRSTVYARRTLLAGFTTVRNLSAMGPMSPPRCAMPSTLESSQVREFSPPARRLARPAGMPIRSMASIRTLAGIWARSMASSMDRTMR